MAESKTEVWLSSLRQDGYLGTGSPADPYDCSTASLFDDRMASFQTNTKLIHLGPGIFLTRGVEQGVSAVWVPQSGQTIRGAGMFNTTIKLIDAKSNPTVLTPT